MKDLRGVMPAMITPFSEDGSLNLAALSEYIAFQRAAGVDGLAVAGTNGEGVSQTVREKKRLLEAVMEQRGDLLIVAGTGTSNLPDAIELTRHAGEVGADAVLVIPPYFYKNPQALGIAAFYRPILDASSIPVLLYSIPQQSAVAITDDILARLEDHPRLAGLKDSQGDWSRTAALIARTRFTVFSGSDELLSRSLAAGSAGCISGTANAFPELIVGVKRTLAAGRMEPAQARLDAAKSILLQYPLIAAAKSVLAHRGLPRMWVRPPLIDLTPPQEAEMISRLRAEGLLD